jgi:hydrogenase/urease accessory protein HupE
MRAMFVEALAIEALVIEALARHGTARRVTAWHGTGAARQVTPPHGTAPHLTARHVTSSSRRRRSGHRAFGAVAAVHLALFLLLVALGSAHVAESHEIRPAYLEITENAQQRFDVLWKQPALGNVAVRLLPHISNGLLEAEPSEESATNSFLVRRWKDLPQTRDSFDGATLRVEGLERTITDVLVTISFANGQTIQRILKPDDPALTVQLQGAGKVPVPAYLTLGIEHILTGFDHLSFVLGLLLLVHGRWRLLQTITAFTVAHSITLAAASLGYVNVSAPVIESLVALSIVFIAVELVGAYRGQKGLTSRQPWLIALTFGLLHGFAFAGSLAEIGLPPDNIPGALLLFNIGVELGQLLFVVSVLAIIQVSHALPWRFERHARWAAAYGIGALAAYWMIERVHVLIPGHI